MVCRLLEDEEDDHHEADLTLKDVVSHSHNILHCTQKCKSRRLLNVFKVGVSIDAVIDLFSPLSALGMNILLYYLNLWIYHRSLLVAMYEYIIIPNAMRS